MASTRIYRTCGTPTNDKIFTLSAWIRFNSATGHVFFGADASNDTSWTQVRFSGDSLEVSAYSQAWVKTTRKFRDFSAWYHIVITCDSTQASAADRIKWWVNGEQITDFSVDNRSNTSLNQSWGWNKNTTVNNIGGENASGYGDFSIAHFHNIDGTAYQASDFGETDATTGQWKAKTSPSVSYGNNGYFLKFGSSGSLGTDSSGNDNTNTIGGTLTQTQDTPDNVFCCLNPLTKRDGGTLTNLNTTYEASTADSSVFGTLAVPAGMKVYFEVKLDSNTAQNFLGIHNKYDGGDGAFVKGGSEAGSYGLKVRGTASVVQYFNNGSSNDTAINNYSNGTIIGVAIDNANGQIHYHVNGTYINSSDPSDNNPAALVTGFDTSVEQYLHFSLDTTATQPKNSFNFGNGYFGTTAVSSANSDDAGYGLFEYAPPTGYYSLCTKNINTYG